MRNSIFLRSLSSVCLAILLLWPLYASAEPPQPLLKEGSGVNWWFVFKFNGTTFPACGANAKRACIFGGKIQPYGTFSQQFIFATDKAPALTKGTGCLGDTVTDPVGATYEQVYDGNYFYVVWNDQFYLDPKIKGCGTSCPGPWGHSKGMVAWDESGAGFIMQVTTPNWPGAASKAEPRPVNGNTLGCLLQPKGKKLIPQNNVTNSQHFFALRLSKDDLALVLKALANASVATNPKDLQIARKGGPQDIQDLVDKLGQKSDSVAVTKEKLSTGVTLISKPSKLNVPPWQMVSAALGGVSLRTATWWGKNKIYTTTPSSHITCWSDSLEVVSELGSVEIAKTGQWDGTVIGLVAGQNHAKLGVSISKNVALSIFGDMNQEGATLKSDGCDTSQNGRGGLFFVVENKTLTDGMKLLLKGKTAGTSEADDD
jgi:hypothetical protein